MKIVVAEDEQRQRDGIVKIIKDIIPDTDCVSFGDGTEVIEYLDRIHYNADILFTDINMPDLSGLDLIRHLNKHNQCLLVIIISGYASFDYAQQAMQLGAFRYILKPIDPEEVEQVLNEAKLKLQSLRPSLLQEYEQVWDTQNKSAVLLERQLNRWIHGKLTEDYKDMLAPIFKSKGVGFLVLCRLEPASDLTDDDNNIKIMLMQDIRDIFMHQYRCYSFFLESNKLEMVTIVLERDGSKQTDFRYDLKNWKQRLKEYYAIDSNIYIGSQNDCLMENIASQYQTDRKKQLYHLFTGEEDSGIPCTTDKAIALLADAIKMNSRDNVIKIMRGLSSSTEQNISTVKKRISEVCYKVSSSFSSSTQLISVHNELIDEAIQQSHSLTDLANDVYLFLRELWELSSDGKSMQQKIYALKIKEYIRLNYEKDISLEDAANYFSLNSSYFSTMVKTLHGCGFQTLLTAMRISKACDLLDKTGLKIQEIAAMVGYRDPSYFIRMFKKTIGMTPDAYRKNKGMQI